MASLVLRQPQSVLTKVILTYRLPAILTRLRDHRIKPRWTGMTSTRPGHRCGSVVGVMVSVKSIIVRLLGHSFKAQVVCNFVSNIFDVWLRVFRWTDVGIGLANRQKRTT